MKIARRMKCGHNADWTIRLVDRGQRYIYCLGCLTEKVGLKTVDGRVPEKIVADSKRVKEMVDKDDESNKKTVQKAKV